MNESRRLAVAAVFLGIVACVIAGVSWWDARRNLTATRGNGQSEGERVSEATLAPSPAWLTGTTEERFGRIKRHLRGLDQAMAEISYRYGELHFAARERLAAIPMIINMLVAISTTKIPILVNEGFWKMAHEARTDWLMVLSSIFLLIVGAGSFSVDALLAGKRNFDETDKRNENK